MPLEIAPTYTVVKIALLAATEYIGRVAVMCVSLYFTRLKLFDINENICGWRERVVFYWCSMIWLSSFTSKSSLDTNQNNYRANVRNTLTETIGMVLSMASNDIIALRFLTTEPNEHNITGWIIRKREATVLEVNQMEHAATNRTISIFASGLQTSRSKQNRYTSTLESLLDDGRSLPQESSSDLVDISFGEAGEAVAYQLWFEVGPIINSLVVSMESLLI